MDLRKLKKLIDLVEESGIAELEMTEGEEKVRITRVSANNTIQYAPAPMTVQAPAFSRRTYAVLAFLSECCPPLIGRFLSIVSQSR